MSLIGGKYVEEHKRSAATVEDKDDQESHRRIYNGRLSNSDHLTDLIEMAKLDYRLGWFFSY